MAKMNRTVQDEFFGRIKISTSYEDGVNLSFSLNSCTVFSYAKNTAFFLLSKLSYFLFIGSLFFGVYVTRDAFAVQNGVYTLLFLVLFSPVIFSVRRELKKKKTDFHWLFLLIFITLLIFSGYKNHVVILLLAYHILDSVVFIVMATRNDFLFPPIPTVAQRFVKQNEGGKLSIGDCILLSTGEFIPADGRILQGSCLCSHGMYGLDSSRSYGVGDGLAQGFRVVSGDVMVEVVRLPSASYYVAYKERIRTLFSQVMTANPYGTLSFLISCAFTVLAATVTGLQIFGFISMEHLLPFLLVLGIVSMSQWVVPIFILIRLETIKQQMMNGYISNVEQIEQLSTYPTSMILDHIVKLGTLETGCELAVKKGWDAKCMSSQESPLRLIAMKKNPNNLVLSLTPFYTEGLKLNAAVLHEKADICLREAVKSELKSRENKKLVIMAYIMLVVLSLFIGVYTFHPLLLSLPFVMYAMIIFFIYLRVKELSE